MNLHNPEIDNIVKDELVELKSEREDVRVIRNRLTEMPELTISEDDDAGSDPYNSTGHHVILKAQRRD